MTNNTDATHGRAVPSLRVGDNHLLVRVHVTPGARQNTTEPSEKIDQNDFAVRMKVRAKPEDGKANSAAIAQLALWIGLAKSRISVQSDHKWRVKTLRLEGDPAELRARLLRATNQSPQA